MQGPIFRIRQAVSPVWKLVFTAEDDERDRGRPAVFTLHVHLNPIAYVELRGVLHGSRVSSDDNTTGVKLQLLTSPLILVPRYCDL